MTRECLMARAGVPARFCGVPPQMPLWDRGGYCISGLPGRGKSHAAAQFVAYELAGLAGDGYVIGSDRDVAAWCPVPGLFSRLRACHQGSGENEHAILRSYLRAEVLVLDDLGASNGTDYVLDVTLALMSARYDAEKPTIVTTNLDGRQWQRLDGRIFSRLASYRQVKLLGVDRRWATP